MPLARLARQARLPVVALPPVYYLKPEQAALQRTVSAIRLNTTLARLPDAAARPSARGFLEPVRAGGALPGLPGGPGCHG